MSTCCKIHLQKLNDLTQNSTVDLQTISQLKVSIRMAVHKQNIVREVQLRKYVNCAHHEGTSWIGIFNIFSGQLMFVQSSTNNRILKMMQNWTNQCRFEGQRCKNNRSSWFAKISYSSMISFKSVWKFEGSRSNGLRNRLLNHVESP